MSASVHANVVDMCAARRERGLDCSCPTCQRCAEHGEPMRGFFEILASAQEGMAELEARRAELRRSGPLGWFQAIFV